jgi:hypothetical protein
VARPEGSEKALKWDAVGRVKNNMAVIDSFDSLALVEGRPIFLAESTINSGDDASQ